MDDDFINQSLVRGFLHFGGIEGVEGCILEGVNVGEFWEGLRMEADLDFGFLLRARFRRAAYRPWHTGSLRSPRIQWRQAYLGSPHAGW